jgi:hypothetical protein
MALVDSSGNAVRSGSGNAIGTRSGNGNNNNNRGRFRTYSAPAPKKKKKAYVAPTPVAAKTSPLASPVIKGSTSQKNSKVIAPKPKTSISLDDRYALQTGARDEQIRLQSKSSVLAINNDDNKSSAQAIVAPKPSENKKPSFIESVTDAVKGLASLGPTAQIGKAIITDKYRNDEPSYNQEYWAGQRAKGVSQADMKAQQDKIGMNKAYSGDVVVSDRDRLAAQYKLKGMGEEAAKQGIKPETTVTKKGFFDETTVTNQKYDFGDGKPYSFTQEKTSPVINGVRLGKDTTKAYADGVLAYERKGDINTGTYSSPTQAHIADRTKIEPMDKLNTVSDIQNAIETTTDKKELAALHKRLRALMRSNKTRTQFGGLRLGDAEVKATQLGTRI